VHIQPANKFNIDTKMKKKTAAYKKYTNLFSGMKVGLYRDRWERKCRLVLNITNLYSSLPYTDSKAMTENKTS